MRSENLRGKLKWAALTILVLAVWFSWIFQKSIARAFGVDWYLETAGQLGDTFGALNTLFGAFGFVAVIATLRMQSQASKLQQIDSHKQQFEQHFFQLLALSRELRASVSSSRIAAGARVVTVEGSEAINQYANRVSRRIISGEVNPEDKNALAETYNDNVHSHDEQGLGAYFRVVYTILRRISEDKIFTEDEAASYGNLLRSQMTSSDAILIGFNALTEDANDFQRYVEKFRMLKYISDGPVKQALQHHYDPIAFLARD